MSETYMDIKSKGFSTGMNGDKQITFVGIYKGDEAYILYRYGVPHCVAYKGKNGWTCLYSQYAVYSSTSYRTTDKFIQSLINERGYFWDWPIRKKNIGECTNPFAFNIKWSYCRPEGYSKAAVEKFNATLVPLEQVHPSWIGLLKKIDEDFQREYARRTYYYGI